MPRPFKSLSWVLKLLAFALGLKWLAWPHGVIVHVWTKGNDICLVWLRVFPSAIAYWLIVMTAMTSAIFDKDNVVYYKHLSYCSHNI